jgi:arabinan endo-1,5-alpha-L-arabinosidase
MSTDSARKRVRRGIVGALGMLLVVGLVAAHAAEGIRVHDPVMIRQGDTYYLFGTGMGIAVHSSKDMKTWKQEPPVFERAPAWTFTTVPGFKGHIWAPDISEHGGTYYLYYAISLPGKITSAIGVATSKTLDRSSREFAWVDRGMVIQSVLGFHPARGAAGVACARQAGAVGAARGCGS